MLEILHIEYSDLTVFASTGNILVFLIKLTRIHFSIWSSKASFSIYLNLGLWIMLD